MVILDILFSLDIITVIVFLILSIPFVLLCYYFKKLNPDQKIKNTIAYFALIAVIIGLYSGKIDIVNLFGDRPDLEADAECKLITSKIVEQKNFSVNESNDYYADIYYLVA